MSDSRAAMAAHAEGDNELQHRSFRGRRITLARDRRAYLALHPPVHLENYIS
jgi:hypothetical protein